MKNTRFFATALGISLILLGLLSMGASGPRVVYAAEIDEEIYSEISDAGQTTFMVLMKDQPDLSAAYDISDWNAKGQFVFNTLQAAAETAQEPVIQRYQSRQVAGNISRFQPYWLVNGIAVTGDKVALEAFAAMQEVGQITSMPKFELLPGEIPTSAPANAVAPEWGITRINADDVWALGYTGTDAVVGVVDSGVQWNHPALINSYRGWDGSSADHNYNWFNPEPLSTSCTNPLIPCDDDGHGTHVNGTATGGSGTNQIGVAPGAKWIHSLGCCPSTESLLAALQWMAAPTDLNGDNPDPNLRPHVVNNSWGGSGGRTTYFNAFQALRAAGVVPVTSAGNSGSSCATMGAPADNEGVFAVGSTQQSGDSISSFSSRGPSPFTGVGPDISAPGSVVRSSYPSNQYQFLSGTSMASPHVSGLVALMIDAEPDLAGKVALIEEIIRKSAVDKTTAQDCAGTDGASIPNNTYGWGRIDALAAVNLVLNAGQLAGLVTDNDFLGIPNATVTLVGTGFSLDLGTSGIGGFDFTIAPGTYTIVVSAFGYVSQTINNVVVSSDNLTTLDVQLTKIATSVVTGTITDGSTANAISDAKVEVVGQPDVATMTDNLGNYALILPDGPHDLKITKVGYADSIETINLPRAVNDYALTPALDYIIVDSGPCAVDYDWVSAVGGSPIDLGDDDNTNVPLPVSINYWGNSYNSIYVGSNGFVSFGAGADRLNGAIPFLAQPNNAVIPFGDDLDPTAGSGRIWGEVRGDDSVVIEYNAVEHWPSGDPETLQLIFLPSGVIVAQYQTVSNPTETVFGIENSDGSKGQLYAGTPASGETLTFVPITGETNCFDTPSSISLGSLNAMQDSNVGIFLILAGLLLTIGSAVVVKRS